MTATYSFNMYPAGKKASVFTAVLLVGVASLTACNHGDGGAVGAAHSNSIAETRVHGDTMDAIAEPPAPLAHVGQQLNYNFDSDPTGRPPAKFHSARTGAGKESRWQVINDPTAPSVPNVVVQTSVDQADYRFPLLIADEASFLDMDLTVKFKAVSGSIDRAAGLAFRLKDPNNYYIARANAVENNYNLYRVVNGRRSEFAGTRLKVTPGEWHELRVEVAGSTITCYYDGNKKIEATDETFKGAGKVGLWTKADSVTYFDDLRVTAR